MMLFWRTVMFVAVGFSPLISSPILAIEASQLALIINTSDPLSVQIGEYYAGQRRLSFQNIIRVAFPPNRAALDRGEFETLKAAIDKRMMPKVQAYWKSVAMPGQGIFVGEPLAAPFRKNAS